jgi:hypothetical protein
LVFAFVRPIFAVEKLDILEIGQIWGIEKCLAEQRKSFVEHPNAMQFLRISGPRVFQHPRLISTAMVF